MNELAKITNKSVEALNQYIEMMAAAYYKTTDISPEEVELVHETKFENDKFVNVYYFRRREK